MSGKHWIMAFVVTVLAVFAVRLLLDFMGVPYWASFTIGVVVGAFACHLYRRRFDPVYANREE